MRGEYANEIRKTNNRLVLYNPSVAIKAGVSILMVLFLVLYLGYSLNLVKGVLFISHFFWGEFVPLLSH